MKKQAASPPTLRDLAKWAGVTHATVSMALRNHSQISPPTRLKIQKLAEKKGYRPHASLSTAMAHMRRGFPASLRSNMAILVFLPDDEMKNFPFNYWVQGASERAHALGYGVEIINLSGGSLDLLKIFQNRAVQGVVIVGGSSQPLRSDFGMMLNQYPLAVIGPPFHDWPSLHHSFADPYTVGFALARHVVNDGFQRIGVCVETGLPTIRIRDGVRAGCESLHARPPDFIEIVGLDQPSEVKFWHWYKKERPDAIITTALSSLSVLKANGVRVPEDVSLFHWNVSSELSEWSGWDQRNKQMGAAAVDLVIGQIHRGEKGLPVDARILGLNGCFQAGTTSRRSRGVHASWLATYSSTKNVPEKAWHCVDFNQKQNSHYNQAWEFPLSHFSPGKKRIHGIPFSITDPEANQLHNCLVAGPHFEKAPLTAPIPISSRASEVYFLHLARFLLNRNLVEKRNKFSYVIQYENLQEEIIDLKAHLPGFTRKGEALLMDWWSPERPVEFLPHARVAQVVSPYELDDYERNLYTFEWINPFPARKIKSITLCVPENSSVSVALLAITLKTK